ncbi:type II toxin-antitoxin system HicA family toxin [Bradyrhizobium sp.]|uniref:type II toxin-antitoxin system HicA family toxin n=1 Tax=Bradyrhizobium sp. TaxID=376 RepID=UPI003C784B99
MLTNSRDIIQRLEREGWTLVRITGSHHVFKAPVSGETLVVPHPKKDLVLSVPFIRALGGSLIEISHGSLHCHH